MKINLKFPAPKKSAAGFKKNFFVSQKKADPDSPFEPKKELPTKTYF